MGRRAVLLLILGLGFAVRIEGLSAVRHNYDHAFPIAQAALWLDRGIWPVEGQRTTIGLPASPLAAYLLAPPVLLFRNPWALHAWMAMLDTLGLALSARLLSAQWRIGIASLTLVLAATSPWRIYFARGTWLPAFFPLWVSLLLACWKPFILRGRRLSTRRIIFGWWIAGLVSQIHPVGVLLFPPIALTAYLAGGPLHAHAIGLGVFVGFLIPYLNDLWRHRTEWGGLRGPAGIWPETPVAFAHALRMASGRHFAEVWGGDLPNALITISNYSATIVELLLALGVFRAVAKGIIGRVAYPMLPAIWWGFPALMLSLRWPYPIHIHYLTPIIASSPLLIAEGLDLLWRRWAKRILIGHLIAIAGLWILLLGQADGNALRHPWTGNWEELPLREVLPLVRILSDWGEGSPPIVVLPAGCVETNPTWLIGLVGRALDVRCGFHPERLALAHIRHPVAHLLGGAFGNPPMLAPLGKAPSVFQLADGSWIAVYEVRPEEVQPAVRLDLPTDIGWRLVGYTLAEGADHLVVITFWRVDYVPEDPMRWSWYMQPFHHLLDPEGRQVQNPSGFGVPGFLWQEGDLYIDRTVMRFPRGKPLRLEIGLFDPNRGVRARFLKDGRLADTFLLRTYPEDPMDQMGDRQ